MSIRFLSKHDAGKIRNFRNFLKKYQSRKIHDEDVDPCLLSTRFSRSYEKHQTRPLLSKLSGWRKRKEKARGAALATPPALYTSERWMCLSTG